MTCGLPCHHPQNLPSAQLGLLSSAPWPIATSQRPSLYPSSGLLLNSPAVSLPPLYGPPQVGLLPSALLAYHPAPITQAAPPNRPPSERPPLPRIWPPALPTTDRRFFLQHSGMSTPSCITQAAPLLHRPASELPSCLPPPLHCPPQVGLHSGLSTRSNHSSCASPPHVLFSSPAASLLPRPVRHRPALFPQHTFAAFQRPKPHPSSGILLSSLSTSLLPRTAHHRSASLPQQSHRSPPSFITQAAPLLHVYFSELFCCLPPPLHCPPTGQPSPLSTPACHHDPTAPAG